MKSFILKSLLFVVLCVALFLAILSSADGNTDAFYLRFTSPVQNQLILGTSRSAQALQPEELNRIMHRSFFNYSFTVAHSPFGPAYLRSIQKKLNPQVTDGIFIVTVDPWSISDAADKANDSLKFGENDLCVGTTHWVNMNPNFEYLWENLQGKYLQAWMPSESGLFLHDDGWLEVTVPMDSLSVERRLQEKLVDYEKEMLPGRVLSQVRLDYLVRTIRFLKTHGHVYVVRLPVCAEILALERKLLPAFNETIEPAVILSDGYMDMTGDTIDMRFVDGNHLWKESGKRVSRSIAEWIKEAEIQNP